MRCRNCGFTFSRDEAVVVGYGNVETVACPKCGCTRMRVSEVFSVEEVVK